MNTTLRAGFTAALLAGTLMCGVQVLPAAAAGLGIGGAVNGAVRTPSTAPATGAINRTTMNAENRANSAAGNAQTRMGAPAAGALGDSASVNGRAQAGVPGAGVNGSVDSGDTMNGADSMANSATGRINSATRNAEHHANTAAGNAGTALNRRQAGATVGGSVNGTAAVPQ